jgi:hypothetical protein
MDTNQYKLLSRDEKINYLRTNGNFYFIEDTKISIRELETYRRFKPSKEPNFTPLDKIFQPASREYLFSYSLYMLEYHKKNLGPLNDPQDLKGLELEHHGRKTNFYDCYVQKLLSSNERLQDWSLNAKTRVYLSKYLSCLADLLVAHNIEVFIMEDFAEDDWNYYGNSWRFLAFGDYEHGSKYTRIADTDYIMSPLDIEMLITGEKHKAQLWSFVTTDYNTNGIDASGYWWVSYLLGSHICFANTSLVTQKNNIEELLTLYYRYGLDKPKFSSVNIFPPFSKEQELAIALNSYSTKSAIGQYAGDQSFMNSVIMFAVLDNKEKVLEFHNDINPTITRNYHFGYPFPLYNFLVETGYGSVIYLK